MKIIFLGTNGWYSTNTGNTTSVFIDSSKYYVIFDAGDGIYKLDRYITKDKPIFLFLSHFHLDHIIGIHSFGKFRFKQLTSIFGQPGTMESIGAITRHPYTIPIDDLPFKVVIKELAEGKHEIPFPVECKPLLHADPCFGYRITLDNKVITYCTDTGVNKNTLELASNADLLIHECAFKSGQHSEIWPHTNPHEAAEIARTAKVKQLILTHFDAFIYQSIAERKQAETEAKSIFNNVIAAVDDMEINI